MKHVGAYANTYPDIELTQPSGAASKKPQQQQTLHKAFKMKLPQNSECAKLIKSALGVFMAFYASDCNISAALGLCTVHHDTNALCDP